MTRTTMKSVAFKSLIALAMSWLPLQATAQAVPEGLLVIYGAAAPSREGDVDHREQMFFSVPADQTNRIFVRLYDPETSGDDDFTYGGPSDSLTTYRVFGGEGAFSAAQRPEMVEDRARGPRGRPDFPVKGPGRAILEDTYGSDRATNGRWVTLGVVRPRQGEQFDGRAWFRIDVEGTKGNDGNGYLVDVSLARDRSRRPEGLQFFAYQPTIRWTKRGSATRLAFGPNAGGPFKVQSFDAANGDLALVTDFADLSIRASGQDFWSVDTVATDDTRLALSLAEGFETPNDVTVSIFDTTGAPVPLMMPPARAPTPGRPIAAGHARPLADCRAVAFDATLSTGRTPLSARWDFGDGNSADRGVIAHRYAAEGRYTAILSVMEPGSRAGRGAQVEVPVHVRSGPTAAPGAPVTVAPGEPVAFDGSASTPSDSPITKYRWTFGDGAQATGVAAQNTYATPGLYRAVLRVEDDSAHPCYFGVATRLVTVNTPPVAEASTNQTAILDETITFSAAASYDIDGTVKGHLWDLGDGTTLEGVTVSHAYAKAGSYTVTLTVTDDSGVANNSATDTMRVDVNAPPVPAIAIPPRPVSVSEVALLDASGSVDADGAILSYLWEFGDGARGEGETVNYAWTAPGAYDVTLTVTDDSGTASAVQQIVQRIIIDAAPVADAGRDQYVTASVVAFDGTGSTDAEGAISAYEWDFGDGSTGTGPTPSHAYARAGVYTATLIVRDESGAPLNQARDTTRITINASPIADAGPDVTVATAERFTLSARASVDPDGRIADHEWTLPDGSTKSGERMAHVLETPGLYRFGLTVFDSFKGGTATDTSEVLVTVNAAPLANAGRDRLVAPGDDVTFDASQSFDSDGALVNHLWTFSDLETPVDAPLTTRTYATPGVYSAQLVVTDDSGVLNATASDDLTIRVNHAPIADAGADQQTDVLQVTLDARGSSDADGDTLSFTWDMGDGSPRRSGRRVTHDYPRSGKFPVTLFVDDGTGLSNATARDAMTVTINARPVASAGENREVCSGESILFDASDSVDPDGGLLLYAWDFGDGQTSDIVNPTKVYEAPGAYPVTLRVQNGSGSDWGRATARIATLVREGPIAHAGADMSVCTNQAVRFDGSASTDADGAVNAFAWTFGDGGTASGERPEYRFKKPGNYAVTLTITGEAVGACSPLDTDTINVEVKAAPAQEIVGPDRAAAGLPARFAAQTGDLGRAEIVSQSWSFSDGGTARGAEVVHTFADPGVYFATVVTELAGGTAGCATIETRRKVIVNAAPQARFDAPPKAAAGQAIVMDAAGSSDADGAIAVFEWDFGDGTTGSGVQTSHRYADAGTYDVTLTVADDAGVGNSQVALTRKIVINPAPVAALRAPGPVCAGQEVPLRARASESTTVTWDIAGTTASGAQTGHRFDAPGLYAVSALLDDGTGLVNAARREEIYVRVNAPPVALAGADQTTCTGEAVVFDASASGDSDGTIDSYEWAFSDGSTATGMRVERRFETTGVIEATLTVTDNSGATCASSSDTARIHVNAPPTVDAGPDQSLLLGAAHDVARFDARGASDPDGQGVRVSWDFGDGQSATGATATHRYASAGTYTVTVTATDPTGLACGIATDTATVTATARD